MTLSRLLYLYLYHAKNMFEHIIGLKAEINRVTTLLLIFFSLYYLVMESYTNHENMLFQH